MNIPQNAVNQGVYSRIAELERDLAIVVQALFHTQQRGDGHYDTAELERIAAKHSR